MWQEIGQKIDEMHLKHDKVRLYQDGLPNSGREDDIVRDLAQAGSLNYQLLLSLIRKGAKLTGTESPALLLEEYELARQVMTAQGSSCTNALVRRYSDLSRRTLEKRDQYIAERIDETLSSVETGLIFLGMLHSLEGRLPPDIRLTHVLSEAISARRK